MGAFAVFASAQCEPPRPSAPATPKTAAPAALISTTEQSHLLRSMILSRHRVIAVPDSIPVPRLRALNQFRCRRRLLAGLS